MKQKYTASNSCFVWILLSILSFGFSTQGAQGQSNKIYANSPDGRTYYELSDRKMLIKFQENASFESIQSVLQKEKYLKRVTKTMVLPSPKNAVLAEITKPLTAEEYNAILKRLEAHTSVVYAHAFLKHEDGTLQGITDRIAVKLRAAGDYAKLDAAIRKNGLKLLEKNMYDPLVYFVQVPKTSMNPLDLANQLAENGQFAWAEVDFMRLMNRFNTNDTFLANQWSLNNTGSSLQNNGTPGADMKVFNAWGISTGSANIKVAILDEGVDLVHPDLQANMLGGFDGTGLNSGGAPSGNDAHGTACAGIVAAVGNNNLGIAGVAYGSKIVPIRIAYSSGSTWVTQNSWIGTCIDWAWQTAGADVLSNSWGGGGSSALINDPITRSVTQGRGGLGAPVLFAAGNNNGAVSYPATLQNVISVVAMSMCNQRKSPTSCDGETFWGSNFGTNADVSAPGVKIYTTDISGNSGYGTGNYTATFNGTSSACPNAAGVMALILSVNPGLTNTQARQIIESTCDKVGGLTYNANVANQPNGTWSTELGHGRVNAFSAVQLANPQPCVNPPSLATASVSPASVCGSGNVSLSLSGVSFGSGQTYQWQSSSDNATWTNISGQTGQTATAAVSTATWFRCLVTCGATTPSTSVQVTINNPTISVFPHTQNFDASSSLPCGWTTQNVNADPRTWNVGATSARSAPNNIVYAYSATLAANDWIFTPPLNLVAGQNYRVRFWYRARSATYAEKLEVKWGASASAAGMTSAAIFSNTNIINTTYVEGISSNIVAATSGIQHIGFRVFSDLDKFDLYIDDITIETVSACTVPTVAGTISGPSSGTAGTAVSYAYSGGNGTSINWQLAVGAGAFADIGGATSNTLNLNQTPGTFQVRARVSKTGCNDEFTSAISLTVSPKVGDNLSLPIVVASLPFTTSNSNAAGSGYTSTYVGTNAQTSPDVFYQFTTGNCTDSIIISTCISSFDTYVHLLSSTGTWIASNDDNGSSCTGTSGSLKALVQPNTTYFTVIEGFGTTTGSFNLTISQIDNPPAVANISANGATTFCAGGSVTLTASAGSSYAWSNGATTQSISVNATGNYSVTVTNANGCSASASQVVTVNELPAVSVSANGATTFCAGGSVTLTASAGSSYAWSNGATTQSISVNATSNYSVTVTNASGCFANASQGVTVNALPTVSAGTYSSVTTLSNAVTLIGTPAGGTFSGTGVSGNSFNPATSGVGTFTLTYSYTDANGCSNSAQSSITVTQACNLTASSISGPTNSCAFQGTTGGNATYSVSATDASSYTWTLPTGSTNISGQGTNTISFKFSSTYTTGTVSVIVGGCSTTTSRSITVTRATPATPGVISGTANVCAIRGTTQTNTYSIAPVANALSYTWVAPTNTVIMSGQGTTSITLQVNTAFTTGSITVRANSGCANSSTRSLALSAAIPATPGTVTGTSLACPGNTFTYSVAAVANAESYNWTVPTGSTIVSGAGTNSIQVNFNAGFIANGTISVRASNGCGTSAARNYTVSRNTPGTPSTIVGQTSGICSATVNYSVTNVAGMTYNWVAPSGTTILSGQGTNAISLSVSPTFVSGTLSVNASNSCSTSANRTASLTSRPATPASITGLATGVCIGSQQTYSTAALPGATSYTWTVPASYSIISGQGTNSIIVNIGTANGSITVRGNNSCGSGSTRSLAVTVTNCARMAAEEIEEAVEFDAFVSPNPFNETFTIRTNGANDEKLQISIVDVSGRIVYNQVAIANETINVSPNLANGIYYVSVTNSADIRKLIKVVKAD